MWYRSKAFFKILEHIEPVDFTDLANEVPEATKGVSFGSPDRAVRVTADRASKAPEERVWMVWDMRGVKKPHGPCETPVSPPVLLAGGIPTLLEAVAVATVVHKSRPLRLALTAQTIARGAFLATKARMQARLEVLRARLS